MDIGFDTIGRAKTNKKCFLKDTIKNMTNDWPVGSYLVLMRKPMVPGYRLLISIGYKYNSGNVIYFSLQRGQGSQKMLSHFYLTTLTNFLMLSFDLFIIPRSYLIPLDPSMKSTSATNPYCHI